MYEIIAAYELIVYYPYYSSYGERDFSTLAGKNSMVFDVLKGVYMYN
jgi:hypothetical protein